MVVKNKRKEIKTKIVSGKFRDIAVSENGKKAGVLILKPNSRKEPDLYVTKVPEKNIHMFRIDARKDIEKTGISKAAIKKLGL